jgi:hypothetical protein
MQQQLLDTVAHLPELEIFRIITTGFSKLGRYAPLNFKPIQGLQYVEQVRVNCRWYMERDRGQPARYRQVSPTHSY